MVRHSPTADFLGGEGCLLDVRSPGEFARGHIPGSHNLPLFSDGERAEIGTLYTTCSRRQAVLRGLAAVGPRLEAMAMELERWHQRSPQAPLRLTCWRGGMRSDSVAWLAERLDLPVVVLRGGYKAYRRWVLELFERNWPLRLLGGRTGCGKTELLQELEVRGAAVVDLEGLAHHRGSSFGGLGLPEQPSSEHFENRIASVLSALAGAKEIWLEAESANVGRCRIPAGLWRQMKEAPVLEVQRPLEQRVEHLVSIYGSQDPAELAEATRRISRRLGPRRTALALEAIAHGDWAAACRQMLDYYDRCYDHELSSHRSSAVDLGGSDPAAAAGALISRGLVTPWR